MDQSRRAVESYWRSRMVDGVTADDDKVAPVYKLEEICELLRASDASIVKEVADFVLKRLDNKSPLVKQKVGAPAHASAPPGIGFACPWVALPCC
jgi:ribonuclease Z